MKSDENPPNLTEEDINLWKEVTKDVQKFENSDYLEKTKAKETKYKNVKNDIKKTEKTQKLEKKTLKSRDIDKKTAEKLKKGQIPIESRLDLHGMRQDQAQDALFQFLFHNIRQRKRCVLVITGKGKSGSAAPDWTIESEGILKQKLPLWLDHPDLAPHILKYVPAIPKDGGDGAFYIYLRRKR